MYAVVERRFLLGSRTTAMGTHGIPQNALTGTQSKAKVYPSGLDAECECTRRAEARDRECAIRPTPRLAGASTTTVLRGSSADLRSTMVHTDAAGLPGHLNVRICVLVLAPRLTSPHIRAFSWLARALDDRICVLVPTTCLTSPQKRTATFCANHNHPVRQKH